MKFFRSMFGKIKLKDVVLGAAGMAAILVVACNGIFNYSEVRAEMAKLRRREGSFVYDASAKTPEVAKAPVLPPSAYSSSTQQKAYADEASAQLTEANAQLPVYQKPDASEVSTQQKPSASESSAQLTEANAQLPVDQNKKSRKWSRVSNALKGFGGGVLTGVVGTQGVNFGIRQHHKAHQAHAAQQRADQHNESLQQLDTQTQLQNERLKELEAKAQSQARVEQLQIQHWATLKRKQKELEEGELKLHQKTAQFAEQCTTLSAQLRQKDQELQQQDRRIEAQLQRLRKDQEEFYKK